jgi:hypothetical protein
VLSLPGAKETASAPTHRRLSLVVEHLLRHPEVPSVTALGRYVAHWNYIIIHIGARFLLKTPPLPARKSFQSMILHTRQNFAFGAPKLISGRRNRTGNVY